jgi:hypothetical protein
MKKERRFFRKEFEKKDLAILQQLGASSMIRNPIHSQLGVFTNSSKKDLTRLKKLRR